MKDKLTQVVLLLIGYVLSLLSSCCSEDFCKNFSEQKSIIIEANPHVLDKEEVLNESLCFFQDGGIELCLKQTFNFRSKQIEPLTTKIKIMNVMACISKKSSKQKIVMQEIPVYIINYKNRKGSASGYTVVIGDERFSEKVIAFNREGECHIFDHDDADFWKDQINGYIQNTINQENEAIANSIQLRNEALPEYYYRKLEWKTRFHQFGSPYSDYTPFRNGVRASAGCTATAMAEIMTYHQWPRLGAYKRYNDNKQLETVHTTYTSHMWDVITMNDDLYYTPPQNNPAARAHIANLFAEIAYKLGTNFVSSTAAYAYPTDVPTVFRQMGFYSGDIQWYYNDSTAFFENIRKEIFEYRRPVFMCGWKSEGGGHAFVIGGVMTHALHAVDLKKVAFIYIKNGRGGIGDSWYSSEIIKRPNSQSTNQELYPYRYDCMIIKGIHRSNNKGSTNLFRVPSNYPY